MPPGDKLRLASQWQAVHFMLSFVCSLQYI